MTQILESDSKTPNSVNFSIANLKGEQNVVHNDRLILVVENGLSKSRQVRHQVKPDIQSDSEISDNDSDVSIYKLDDEEVDSEEEEIVPRDIRPTRQRLTLFHGTHFIYSNLGGL